MKESNDCRVCIVEKRAVVFNSCGHAVCCKGCAKKVPDCPVCRVRVNGMTNVFL